MSLVNSSSSQLFLRLRCFRFGEWWQWLRCWWLSLEEAADEEEVIRSRLTKLLGLEWTLDNLTLLFFIASTLFSTRVLNTASNFAASKHIVLGGSIHKSSVETALSVFSILCSFLTVMYVEQAPCFLEGDIDCIFTEMCYCIIYFVGIFRFRNVFPDSLLWRLHDDDRFSCPFILSATKDNNVLLLFYLYNKKCKFYWINYAFKK